MAGYFRQRSKAGHTMSRPPMHPEPDIAAFRRFYAEGGYCAPEQGYAGGGKVAKIIEALSHAGRDALENIMLDPTDYNAALRGEFRMPRGGREVETVLQGNQDQLKDDILRGIGGSRFDDITNIPHVSGTGFGSFSYLPKVAEDYAGNNGVVMRIPRRSTVHGLDMRSINPGEGEYLMAPRQGFDVTDIFKSPRGHYLMDLSPSDYRKTDPEIYARGGSVADDFNLYQSQYYARGGEVDDDKVTKASVDYSPGMGKTRCRNCAHYQGGSCEIVRGDIDPDYWCQEFERGYARGGSVLDDLNLYQSQYYAGGGAVSHLRNWLKVLAEGLEMPMGVRAHAEVVPKIIADGRFKSQFETGTSNGAFDPDFRRQIESNLFDIPMDTPDARRPIYGSLFDPSVRSSFNSASSYGNVIGVPHPEVKNRSTFTWGDSFGASRSYPFEDMLLNVRSPKAEPIQNLWQTAARRDPTKNPNQWSPNTYNDFWNLSGIAPYGYIETQTHGGLPISDLSRWVWDHYDLHGAPPFSKVADDTGVPVIGRMNEDYQSTNPWMLFQPGETHVEDIGPVLRKEDLGYVSPKDWTYAYGGSVDPNAGQSGIGVYDDTVDGPINGFWENYR